MPSTALHAKFIVTETPKPALLRPNTLTQSSPGIHPWSWALAKPTLDPTAAAAFGQRHYAERFLLWVYMSCRPMIFLTSTFWFRMIPCAWGIARLSLFPRKSLQEGPLSCLLMLVFCTAEANKDWFAQGNKHVFLGVWWLLAFSNKNCLIQDFLNWQNPSGLWKECKDVPSYFKASFSLCRGISLLMLKLKEWGVERSLNKVLPLGSFQSRNFFFIRSTNTWKYIFIIIGYLGPVWTVIAISHIISVASPFVLIFFPSVFLSLTT